MKIETVECFYCAIPEVQPIGDGSQDALIFRVRAGDFTGWGESEAAPLVSIANWVCPMSHSACRNPREAVLGARLESPEDIAAITRIVKEYGLDIAQTDHTWSGLETALWDLLGKARGEPVYRLLGYAESHPRLPYASLLFGDEPQETLQKAKSVRARHYRVAKFGWGPFGRGTAAQDRDQMAAAREGLGTDGVLLVDAGTIWGEDVERAAQILPALREFDVTWLEEPFPGEAVDAYAGLAARMDCSGLAGGEGAQNYHEAKLLMDHGGISYVQIDAGRIGGIGPSKQVADYARKRGITYVNHTFTTHLALSASLQPYAGHPGELICEYPVEASPLAARLTTGRIERDADGLVRLPEKPGLGLEPDPAVIRQYLQDVHITVNGQTLYQTPDL